MLLIIEATEKVRLVGSFTERITHQARHDTFSETIIFPNHGSQELGIRRTYWPASNITLSIHTRRKTPFQRAGFTHHSRHTTNRQRIKRNEVWEVGFNTKTPGIRFKHFSSWGRFQNHLF